VEGNFSFFTAKVDKFMRQNYLLYVKPATFCIYQNSVQKLSCATPESIPDTICEANGRKLFNDFKKLLHEAI
jgi:hypothetical protein